MSGLRALAWDSLELVSLVICTVCSDTPVHTHLSHVSPIPSSALASHCTPVSYLEAITLTPQSSGLRCPWIGRQNGGSWAGAARWPIPYHHW